MSKDDEKAKAFYLKVLIGKAIKSANELEVEEPDLVRPIHWPTPSLKAKGEDI